MRKKIAITETKKSVVIDDIEQLISLGDDIDEVVILKPAVSRYAYKVRKQDKRPVDLFKLIDVYIACARADYSSQKNLDTITISAKDARALLVSN